MKLFTTAFIFGILVSVLSPETLTSQNIRFYKSNPSQSVHSIDFDTDSILYVAVKADSSLLGYDMLMFTTELSRKNGKRKWRKTNNLMPGTFYRKLRDDGYYHFVAYRNLGGGLSHSEIGLTFDDFRFGKMQMNISLVGKKKLNTLDISGSETSQKLNLINATNGYIQYGADIIDFSLPVILEKFSESANIRVKKNVTTAGVYTGLGCLVLSPLLLLIPLL